MESADVVLEVFLPFGDISFQVDSVRNQCNKNIQKLMEEMHFLEMVSTRELMFCQEPAVFSCISCSAFFFSFFDNWNIPPATNQGLYKFRSWKVEK